MKANQTISETTSSIQMSGYTSEGKYGGLLIQSPTKRLRNNLFALFAYMDSITSTYFILHKIISIWRLLQLFGSSFLVAYRNLWDSNAPTEPGLFFFSILFHIIPIGYREDASFIFSIIYSAITIILLLAIIILAFYFKQYAKLPPYSATIISIVIYTIMYIIQPVEMELIGETISHLINGYEYSYSKVIMIVIIVISLICFVAFFVIFQQVVSISLIFRANSLLTINPVVNSNILLFTSLLSLISGIGAFLKDIPPIILLAICIVLYIFNGLYSLNSLGLVSQFYRYLLFGISFGGAINMLIGLIYIVTDKKAGEMEFFIFLAVVIIACFIGNLVISRNIRKQLLTLDFIYDDTSLLEKYKQKQLLRLAVTGMEYAHPICIDFSIFKYITENYSDYSMAWVVFGRFAAIYPEESSVLSFIGRNIVSKKLKGSIIKQCVAQITQIIQQRETNLSPGLKRKISRIQQNVLSAKRRLRHVWDQVIQGNLSEMESSINLAYDAVMLSEAEFNHILSEYPNNRFVARVYSRFLHDVIADQQEFAKWTDYVRDLQRGGTVKEDQAHQLGLSAFPMLPQNTNNAGTTTLLLDSESQNDLEIDETESDQDAEQANAVKEIVNKVTIPGIRNSYVFLSIIVIVLVLFPVIFMLCYSMTFTTSQSTGLYVLYHTSYLRSLQFQIAPFMHHYLFEVTPPEAPYFDKVTLDSPPSSLGGSYDTKEQIRFLVQEATYQSEQLLQYRTFAQDDPDFEVARNYIFGSGITYTEYVTLEDTQTTNKSLQSIILDICVLASKFIDIQNKTVDLVDTTILLNPAMNSASVANLISTGLEETFAYMNTNKEKLQKVFTIVEFVYMIVFLIIILCYMFGILHQIQSNKNTIFKCLMSIPKNVVVQLCEQLRTLKKDGGNSESTSANEKAENDEFSKQEENILKILTTASDGSKTRVADNVMIIVGSIIIFGLLVAADIVMINLYTNQLDLICENAPHLNYILGTTGYLIGMFMGINNFAGTVNGFGLGGFDPQVLIDRTIERIKIFRNYYNLARYGGPTDDEIPFPTFNSELVDIENSLACSEERLAQIPTTYKMSYECMSPGLQILLVEPFIMELIEDWQSGITEDFDTHGELFDELWYMCAFNIYENFLFPMFDGIVPRIETRLSDSSNSAILSAVIIMVLVVAIMLIMFSVIYETNKRLKFGLSLLFHVQPSVVLQTPKIMAVLGGNFTDSKADNTSKNSVFFDLVVEELPDSIITTDANYTIQAANKNTSSIYKVNSEELIGKNVKDVLSSMNFKEPPTANLYEKHEIENCQLVDSDGSIIHLHISCFVAGNANVIISRNITQTVMYNTLIREEKMKSDKLLGSILPASLVPRVQAGEKNICFSVQSASISFIDIVSFTPWCASNTAAVVMKTLNLMFKEFDSLVATHSTLSKMKCIGDCYMMAGGIFSEVNQPSLHAKEAVEFGLEAIQGLQKINQETGNKLQCRVGINTGGPLVAGVIGTAKPTFEILGPAINMAQQMEHHGVPMQVHISRSVYELIYGGPFEIKERGQIEVKQGTVVTYLVTGKK